ncbi:MAG TPA: thiamine pyrophosphate-dependent enzyme [Bryobacteraceae bacterium]|nr:thiamine pyrophosphate-dependent enzyme [Bryobacteraceae bacterium]
MPTTAEILIETLTDWGIDTIFGLPGDGINGIIEAIRKAEERKKLRFIQVRHEEAAAFMACGYAKFTGKIGCCLATSGPGGIHLLNGLYDAKLDGAPVLAITGMQFHDLLGTHTQQDVALDKLFMDVCVYNERVMGAAHMQNVAELACRTALSYRGVAHITIPVDIQDQELSKDARSKRNKPGHVSDVWAHRVRLPAKSDLQKAAEILNDGKRVAILAGQGALGAGQELEYIADTLGAPIIKALLGKCCVPDDSPYTTGGLGLLGTEPSEDAIRNCDTLLIVGSSFPYIEFYPKPDDARAVQIDINPTRIGLRYPVEVGLVGDAKCSLTALVPLLRRKKNRKFLESAQDGMKQWRKTMATRASDMSKPMKPQVIAHELGRFLPEDAIVTSDSGTITTWWARHIPAKRGQLHSCSGTLATMACGLPYAIAAQIAYPDRTVAAFVGDGGLSMLMAEMATCVKYNLPIKIVVIKNNYLGQIMWEQMVFLGNPEFACDLQPIDFAAVARGFGVTAFTLEDPKRASAVVEEAVNHRGPVLIEAVVDPYSPPLPPKIKSDQALHFAESIARGTPERGKIMKTILEEKARELV